MAKGIPTVLEVSQMADRGEDLSKVTAYVSWTKQTIRRFKWTRVQSGRYVRILGEYTVTIESCEYDGACVEGDTGWAVRWQPLQIGNVAHEGQAEFPYRTVKLAKAAAEEQFTNEREENPRVTGVDGKRRSFTDPRKKRANNPGPTPSLVRYLSF